MATHFSILAWRIPWSEEPGRLQSMGLKELDITEPFSTHTFMICAFFYVYFNLTNFKEC